MARWKGIYLKSRRPYDCSLLSQAISYHWFRNKRWHYRVRAKIWLIVHILWLDELDASLDLWLLSIVKILVACCWHGKVPGNKPATWQSIFALPNIHIRWQNLVQPRKQKRFTCQFVFYQHSSISACFHFPRFWGFFIGQNMEISNHLTTHCVQERDDELARKLVTQTGSEKDDDTEDPHSSAVHIQLAMSETKPFTRYWAWPKLCLCLGWLTSQLQVYLRTDLLRQFYVLPHW